MVNAGAELASGLRQLQDLQRTLSFNPQQPYEVGSTVIHILQMRELRTQWLSHCPRRGPKLGHPGTGIHSCVIGLKSLHVTQWSQAAYLLGPHMHHTKLVYISIHSLDTTMKPC